MNRTRHEKALPCPFCGMHPEQGFGPVTYCQLHGDPDRNWFIRCPNKHAKITAADQDRALKIWNTRIPTTSPNPPAERNEA